MIERTEFITGLRELADYLENNEAVPLPHIGYVSGYICNREDAEEAKARMAEVASCPGPWSKTVSEDYFHLNREFGGGITYSVFCDRNIVCKMVEPAKPAVWDCEPILSAKEFEELTA